MVGMVMFYLDSVISSVFFFCFKQKTADEMRISDWRSDVCSSDLFQPLIASLGLGVMKLGLGQPREKAGLALATSLDVGLDLRALQPLQCVRQASVGSRRSIDASDAE